MDRVLTKKATDYSDENSFAFSYFCDRCGKEWGSPAVQFQAEKEMKIEHTEARKLIWAGEHHAALNEANLGAHLHFNFCPHCGKWVCYDCFDHDKELCRDCMEEKEHGLLCTGCAPGRT